MTDKEWKRLLRDLHAIETHDDVDRAVAAAMRLSQLDDASRLPDLKAFVETADFFVLEAIGTPIARLEGLEALPLLLHMLDRGTAQGHDCDGLGSTIMDLISVRPHDAAPILLEMLQSEDNRIRRHGAWLLGFAHEAGDPEPLLNLLDDPDPQIRSAAVGSLGSFESRSAVFDALARMLDDADEEVRVSAAVSLGYYGDQRAVGLLEKAKSDSSKRVRDFATYALGRLLGTDG